MKLFFQWLGQTDVLTSPEAHAGETKLQCFYCIDLSSILPLKPLVIKIPNIRSLLPSTDQVNTIRGLDC